MTGTWPQPYEGIRGTDREDWLLSLDEQAVVWRECLIAMARHLRSATMVGRPAPVARRIGEQMRHPQPGDLVATVEVLHGQGDPEYRTMGFGIYLGGRREWYETDAKWAAFCADEAAGGGDPGNLALITSEENRATDKVFYIQYGPAAGDICRWHNSEAVALPVTVTGFGIDAAAKRDEAGAVFTRDSLTGALADSGFYLRGQAGPLPEDAGGEQEVTILVPSGQVIRVREYDTTLGTWIPA